MLQDVAAIGLCIEKFKSAGGTVFYDLRHTTLYDNIVGMHEANLQVDLLTLSQHLKDRNQLEACGGLAYLTGLIECAPSPANVTYYADIVLEKHSARRMIQTCTNVVARFYDDESEGISNLIDEAEREILKVRGDREQSVVVPVKELVLDAITTIEDFHQRQGALTGIATGFPDFDKMTNGLQDSDMIVIAGRPASGKSALLGNIVEHIAIDLGLPCGIFSLEMTARSLIMRMLCSRARVNIRGVRDGFMSERDFPKLTGAAGKISRAPIYIDETSSMTVMQLRAKARRMVQQYGLKLIGIDYLQLLEGASSSSRRDQRQQVVAEISRGIKGLAKELGIPIIVLAQLNREMEREKRKPRLSDLRETGQIEMDADVVGLLYTPRDEEDESSSHSDCIPTNLLIAKQRQGPTGTVALTFLKGYTKFESAARVSADDVAPSLPYVE